MSSARNLGLDNVQGEWISFIDADDWVEVDYLAGLTENLDADFITGGMKDTQGNICVAESRLYSNLEIKEFIEQHNRDVLLRAVWGKLLRRGIIENNSIRFDKRIRWGEDTVFNKRYLLNCNSVRSIVFANYNYYIDEICIIAEKYFLKLEDINYVSNLISTMNISLSDKFDWQIDEDEIKVFFFQLGSFNQIVDDFSKYVELCKKYYPNFLDKQILEDSFMSPIIKGIVKIKLLYSQEKYIDAKRHYDKFCFFCKKMPWKLRFQYKDFYLWYFLIKCRIWWLFDKILKVYCKLKKYNKEI